MQEYKISEEEVRKILWRIRVLLPLFAICFCLASLALFYMTGSNESRNYVLPAAIVAITVFMIVAWRYTLKSNTEYFVSYRLIINDEVVKEMAAHRPENSIELSKIGSIKAMGDGTIVVISRSGRKHIRIHKHIENRDALLAELNLIRQVASAPSSVFNSAMRIAATLVFLACGAVGAFSDNDKVIAICGMITGAMIAVGSIVIIANRRADPKLKKLAKIVLAVMAIGVVSTLLLRLLLPHQ